MGGVILAAINAWPRAPPRRFPRRGQHPESAAIFLATKPQRGATPPCQSMPNGAKTGQDRGPDYLDDHEQLR